MQVNTRHEAGLGRVSLDGGERERERERGGGGGSRQCGKDKMLN